MTWLLEFGGFGFGLLQREESGVGVFPEGEEIFVGGEGADAGGVAIGGRDFGRSIPTQANTGLEWATRPARIGVTSPAFAKNPRKAGPPRSA